MERQFVDSVRIQTYGCVRDATIKLTPLHALIGPNDSGKSTVLDALHTVGDFVSHGGVVRVGTSRYSSNSKLSVGLSGTEVTFGERAGAWSAIVDGKAVPLPSQSALLAPLHAANLVRWDPDEIRAPAGLIAEGHPLDLSERGRGLPAVYDAILSRDRDVFQAIELKVRELFPSVRRIWLPTASNFEKTLGVELVDGTKVQGSKLSEGLLYWLAFAVLPFVRATPLLLIEEPENGLHPSRIAEVMRVLREMSKTTQIVLATHSPLVINELQPDEVTLLTRDPMTGTIATPIVETTAFKAREKVYALGELWLSFADGLTEAALVDHKTRTTG